MVVSVRMEVVDMEGYRFRICLNRGIERLIGCAGCLKDREGLRMSFRF